MPRATRILAHAGQILDVGLGPFEQVAALAAAHVEDALGRALFRRLGNEHGLYPVVEAAQSVDQRLLALLMRLLLVSIVVVGHLGRIARCSRGRRRAYIGMMLVLALLMTVRSHWMAAAAAAAVAATVLMVLVARRLGR